MRAEGTAGRAADLEGVKGAEQGSLMTRQGFRHELAIYRGLEAFADAVVPFVRDAVDLDEPVMVVVDRPRIGLLHDHLGAGAAAVRFADIEVVGRNPGRLISVWREFADEVREQGRPFRGVGEPVSPRRTTAALEECQQHERLLNEAFETEERFWVLCPYDEAALAPAVVERAAVSHPLVVDEAAGRRLSPTYRAGPCSDELLGAPLPVPPAHARRIEFETSSLARVRRLAREVAEGLGMTESRRDDLALAVHELAANSVLHGGGSGTLLLWAEPDGYLAGEVRDGGRLTSALVGRSRPDVGGGGGRGVWLVHELCDLVQVRSSDAGTTVRVRVALS